ncbi:MAG: CHAT domain-containing tetratricopeptide repeat protein [Candidatus Eisenbacteria bacterium]
MRKHVVPILVATVLASYAQCSAGTWGDLLSLADSLYQAEEYDSAFVVGQEALDTAIETLSEPDSATALIIHHLGLYSKGVGNNSRAESLFTRALEIRERLLGPDHLDVATTLAELAGAVLDQYRYEEARQLAERALAIRETALGPNNMDVVTSLNRLALACYNLADYQTAEDLVEKALGICHELYGDDMYIEPSLGNLFFFGSVVYHEHGKYAEAERLQLYALANRERNLGSANPAVAMSLSSLGRAYREQARYAEAEEVYKRALALVEETLGPDDLRIGMFTNDLATLYWYQGRYDDAEAYYKRSLAIAEKHLPPGHIYIASSLSNLGGVYEVKGDYAKAEEYHRRALPMWRDFYGFDHPSYARNLSNLALLLQMQERYSEAESLFTEALAIYEETSGPDHHMAGWSRCNLGNLYVAMGRYAEARSYLERGLAITEKGLGENHPDVAEALESLSWLCRLTQDDERAMELSNRAFGIRFKNFSDNSYALAERDALKYSKEMRTSADKYISCYFGCDAATAQDTRCLADIVLHSKGSVSDGIFERRAALVEATDSVGLGLADALRDVQLEISQRFVAGPGDEGTEAYSHLMDSLSTAAGELESALARRSASFRRRQLAKDVDFSRIQEILPEATVLVEYLKFDSYRTLTANTVPHYLVMIIHKTGEPALLDLGEAREIDGIVTRYREHMLRVASAEHLPVEPDKDDYASIAADLYRAVVRPVEPFLSGGETAFIAPDAGLNLVSFAGLIRPDGLYLVETNTIHYLSAGRDLARLEHDWPVGSGLLALGDPDYEVSDAEHLSMIQPTERDSLLACSSGTRSARTACDDLLAMKVPPLPHSRREVERIGEAWAGATSEPVTVYCGREASEENLKAMAPDSRVIHLATHGYFLGGKCTPDAGKAPEAGSEFIGENPLLLSGLLLAGANLGGRVADSLGCEDGVVTAFEVSGMRLNHTEAVVLSACESALGEVREGEGVYGLRRAFQMAGVRVVLSALWPISDESTADMMEQLYGRGGETLPEAIRRIQLAAIEELRSQGRCDHPYGWAAFVASGSWQ